MMYQEGIVPNSTTKKKKQNKEKDEEKSQLYTEEGEEEKAMIKGKKDHANLDWLDSIETMLSDEEKALVEKTDDWVYIDSLVSNKDKARIVILMKNEEFLISMEAEQGASNRLNHTVSPRTGIEIQQEVTCSKQEDNTFTEVGERNPENKNFKRTMLPEEQESEPGR